MSKVLEIAITQIGIAEDPPNSNKVKYNDWVYSKPTSGSSYPWCGAFVSWCFNEAKLPLGRIDLNTGFVGCPFAVKNVDKWGRIVTIPQAGDVVFYDWEGDGKFDHTGIFEKDLGKGLFSAIEGNTSFKNNSNGGEVMRRSDRKYKTAIFVRPKVIDC
tara:strand:+ start:37 stop:510 length:474 start_codon:yes stop_codon:yes gene_type:complete